MFDNCKEIRSLWHDSSSFNRPVAKGDEFAVPAPQSVEQCAERCPRKRTQTRAKESGTKWSGPSRALAPAGSLKCVRVQREESPSPLPAPDWVASPRTQMWTAATREHFQTHIHTRHLPRSHLHTISQQPPQSCTYSSGLSGSLLSCRSDAKSTFEIVIPRTAGRGANGAIGLDSGFMSPWVHCDVIEN